MEKRETQLRCAALAMHKAIIGIMRLDELEEAAARTDISEFLDATIKYNHAFNNLTIIASPKVLLALYDLANLMINHLKNNNVVDYEIRYTKKFTNLIKEMRSDLYGSKSINKELTEIYLISGVLKSTNSSDN